VTHIRFTTAPDVYDGFGTETLEVLPFKNQHGRTPYRKVEIPDQSLEWQTERYASGMYPRLDEKAFDEWKAYGLIVPT
jgi:hypothetical protein